MSKKDSKEFWLNLEKKLPKPTFALGPYTSDALISDPALIAFISSRYKFCSRMLAGLDTVIEIGCGDGFGASLVAQSVNKIIATDINEPLLNDNKSRMKDFPNIKYEYHDFREKPYQEKVDGIFLIDVIEHIFPEEEQVFLDNLKSSLKDHGICMIGTPNIEAEKYAGKFSREGHVNLKDHISLKSLGNEHFNNSFLFSMNDELVHTGFSAMAHFLWVLCVSPRN